MNIGKDGSVELRGFRFVRARTLNGMPVSSPDGTPMFCIPGGKQVPLERLDRVAADMEAFAQARCDGDESPK
jgi:hypothetical protein